MRETFNERRGETDRCSGRSKHGLGWMPYGLSLCLINWRSSAGPSLSWGWQRMLLVVYLGKEHSFGSQIRG